MTAPPAPASPRFEVLEHLGRGASAEVYRVRMTATGEERVLKRIALATERRWPVARAEQELAVLRRLEHPHVVRLLEVDLRDGALEVFYPFHPGETLEARLGREGALELDEGLRVLAGVLSGLAYLHGQDLVHRDLKPENVYLTHEGQVILLDLGLVKDLGSSEDLTATGEFVGTPLYTAPETFRLAGATAAMDLYSAAILAFVMLTGQRPYGAVQDLPSLLEAHLSTPMPALGYVGVAAPPELEELLAGMAEKDPEARPGALAALEVVERLRAGPPPPREEADSGARGATETWTGAPLEAPAPAPRHTSRRRAAAGVVLALGVALGATLLGPSTPPAAPASPPEPAPTPAAALADLEAIEALVDSWRGAGRPDPAVDFSRVAAAPAMADLRARWYELAPAARRTLGQALEARSAEARAVGFPPILVPFRWPEGAPGAGEPPPARCRAAVLHYGGEVPTASLPPGTAAAAAAVAAAQAELRAVRERLREDPTSIVGTSGSLGLFRAVVRTEAGDDLWYVLSTAADPEARRGLYEAYEDGIVASLRATRSLVAVAARATEGDAQIVAEAWLRRELAQMRPALLLALYFVPPSDLLAHLPPGRREVAAAALHGMVDRVRKAAGLPLGEAVAEAVRAARAARRRDPPPRKVARLQAALVFEAELRALLRLDGSTEAIAFLESSRPRWSELAPGTLRDLLVDAVLGLKQRLDRVPAALQEDLLARLEVPGAGVPESPERWEVARALLKNSP